MILAYRNGTLISVTLVRKHPITTLVRDADKKEYCYRESDTNRKLFTSQDAVAEAIAWIKEEWV